MEKTLARAQADAVMEGKQDKTSEMIFAQFEAMNKRMDEINKFLAHIDGGVGKVGQKVDVVGSDLGKTSAALAESSLSIEQTVTKTLEEIGNLDNGIKDLKKEFAKNKEEDFTRKCNELFKQSTRALSIEDRFYSLIACVIVKIYQLWKIIVFINKILNYIVTFINSAHSINYQMLLACCLGSIYISTTLYPILVMGELGIIMMIINTISSFATGGKLENYEAVSMLLKYFFDFLFKFLKTVYYYGSAPVILATKVISNSFIDSEPGTIVTEYFGATKDTSKEYIDIIMRKFTDFSSMTVSQFRKDIRAEVITGVSEGLSSVVSDSFATALNTTGITHTASTIIEKSEAMKDYFMGAIDNIGVSWFNSDNETVKTAASTVATASILNNETSLSGLNVRKNVGKLARSIQDKFSKKNESVTGWNVRQNLGKAYDFMTRKNTTVGGRKRKGKGKGRKTKRGGARPYRLSLFSRHTRRHTSFPSENISDIMKKFVGSYKMPSYTESSFEIMRMQTMFLSSFSDNILNYAVDSIENLSAFIHKLNNKRVIQQLYQGANRTTRKDFKTMSIFFEHLLNPNFLKSNLKLFDELSI